MSGARSLPSTMDIGDSARADTDASGVGTGADANARGTIVVLVVVVMLLLYLTYKMMMDDIAEDIGVEKTWAGLRGCLSKCSGKDRKCADKCLDENRPVFIKADKKVVPDTKRSPVF